MAAIRTQKILRRSPSKVVRVALVIVVLFAGFASLLLEKHHPISVDDASVQAVLHSSGESNQQPDHSTTVETHHCQLAHFLGVTVERETGSGLPSGKFGPTLLNRPSGRIDAPTHQPPRA